MLSVEMLLEELEELPEGKIRQIGRMSTAIMSSLDRESGSIVRWQRGNLIGFGSFGRVWLALDVILNLFHVYVIEYLMQDVKVYLGMNLDSGELFVVKQVKQQYSIVALEFKIFRSYSWAKKEAKK